MTRPVKPAALVILTFCMVYPGVTLLYQGLYPFVAGEQFSLWSQTGPWMALATNMNVPVWVVSLLKTGLGLAWVAGVLGLWAGDWKAYPLVLAAAAGSLLSPVGPSIMSVIALICLLMFREDPETVPA